MPSNENSNQHNEVKQNRENSFRKTVRKAPGTRVGTLEDWRGAGNSGKMSGRHGQSIRDGR
jgi:hypothetical protein